MTRAFLLVIAFFCCNAYAESNRSRIVDLPPAPAEAIWIEPVALKIKTIVEVDACETGPDDPQEIGRLTATWNLKGTLQAEGWVSHNGSERINPAKSAAWQVGSRVVIAYHVDRDPFPESPFAACLAYSKVAFAIVGLPARPESVSVYQRRQQYSEPTAVDLR